MSLENVACEGVPEGDSLSSAGVGPRYPLYVLVKSALEWTAALVLTVIVGPLILLLALLTRASSPGPAFYSQVRQGYRGRPFRIYKIRSMAHNCEAATGAVWSPGATDPRVTRLGRLLRDTHLDELPQLINVLKGDMSLIGPRPERPEIASRLERMLPEYCNRLLLKPGVTGLAQVELPPDVDVESVRRKLAFDLHYVREATPLLDAKILFATFFQFLGAAINAIGKALVKSEKVAVERQNYGGLKIVASDNWHVGAA